MTDSTASVELPDLTVPRPEVSALLAAIGIHLDTTLAPSLVMAATDMLAAGELAEALPEGADFLGAAQALHTFRPGIELPEPVLVAVQAVYQEMLVMVDGLPRERLRALADKLGI